MNSSDMDLLLDSTTSLNLPNLEKSSDDDIEKLLKKMENLLSPHDHSVFDSNGNKSVGDILKAADELIHSSSPLFEALSPSDSQSNSGNSQNISSKSFKIDIPQLPFYDKPLSLASNDENIDTSAVSWAKVNSEDNNEDFNRVNTQKNNMSMNLNSNNNKDQVSLSFENKHIPELKPEEVANGKKINENNLNKCLQFQDIINVVQNKKKNFTKAHSKFDKHRQLNIKSDEERKVKTAQVISNHKPENNRIKTKDNERVKDISKNTQQTKTHLDSINDVLLDKNINKSNIRNQFENECRETCEAIKSDFTIFKSGLMSSRSTELKSVEEITPDIVSDVQSPTRTQSSNKETFWSGLKDSFAVSHGQQELKMSDLATPDKGVCSLEEELEIQRNKVRQLKEELNNTVKSHLHQLECMNIAHEEELALIQRQMKLQQETELKRRLSARAPGNDKATTPLDDHLLSSYDKENKKLCQEIKTLKTEFREAENKWMEEKSKLTLQLDQAETDSLSKQLKEARTTIKSLEQTLNVLRATEDGDASDVIHKLEHQNFQLMNEICELTKKINDGNAKSEDVVQTKDAEIARLHNELKQPKSGSFAEETNAVRELKAQLSEERAQLKSVTADKEILTKENHDLRRQVRELEIIVKKRNTTGCLTITGQEFFPETEKIKHLESQLIDKDKLIEKLTQDLDALAKKYKTNIGLLESQLKSEGEKVKVECEKVRKLKAAHTKEVEELKRATKKSINVKDDAHLLATIRGLQSELLSKEKTLSKMNKELDDVKKTNRTLQKEREKILSSKNDSKHSSTQSLKSAGTSPLIPSPDHSSEIAQLKLKIKEMEEDIITLHEKAACDLEMLRDQHCSELSAAKSSQGNVAELEGQIYTQEIIISHLKQKLVALESLQNSQALLKLEKESLATQLTEANTIIAKLKDTPLNPLDPSGSSQSQSVLSKIDYLEKRHEVREKTLQAIIHELLSDKKVNAHCMGDCQSKLLDKNREICYYRAEMDRILDSLRQYKQNH